MQTRMLHLLFEGKIDWIETDHAPHLLHDKRKASGIPGLPFYPRFISILQNMGMDNKQIEELTHSSICRGFGIDIKTTQRQPDLTLAGEYEFDPFLHYNRNL
jgi:dihydroorotase